MILTIGAFDGFHRGHTKLLELSREAAELLGISWGVLTFWPHPGVFIGKIDGTVFTVRERELIRRVIGVPSLFMLDFSDSLKNMEPRDFLDKVFDKFGARGFVIGSDFRFGRGGAGDAAFIKRFCADAKLLFRSVEPVLLGGVRCSSTDVRAAVMRGEPEAAAVILGYPWFFLSGVVHGDARGRTIGFPTANLDISGRSVMLPSGVYAAAIVIDGKLRCGALSVGDNPTFGGAGKTTAEVFVLDFDGDLYGREFPVFVFKRLRPMIKFNGADELARQIAADTEECRKIFSLRSAGNSRGDDMLGSFCRCFSEMDSDFVPQIYRL